MPNQHVMLIALILLSPLAMHAEEKQVPSLAALTNTVRAGDKAAREKALDQIRQVKPLAEADKRLVFALFDDATLPADVRTAAFEVLLNNGGPAPQFVAPLLKIASNRREPDAIRQMAFIELQLIVQVSDHAPLYDDIRALAPGLMPTTDEAPASPDAIRDCVRLMCQVAKDPSESKDLRAGVIGSVTQLPDHEGKTKEMLQKICANRAEPQSVRDTALMAARIFPLLNPQYTAEFAELTLNMAVDTSEPQSTRLMALSTFSELSFRSWSDLILHEDEGWGAKLLRALSHASTEIRIRQSSEEHSRALFKVLADPSEDRSLRELAGGVFSFLPMIDKRLVPPLVELLQSGDPYIGDEAADALGAIGLPARRAAAPALVAAWLDAEQPPEVCEAAGKALFKVDRRQAVALGIEDD